MSYKKKEVVVKTPYAKKVKVKGKKLKKRYDKKNKYKKAKIEEGFDDAKFCPSCGAPMKSKVCEACGVKLE